MPACACLRSRSEDRSVAKLVDIKQDLFGELHGADQVRGGEGLMTTGR